MESGIAAAGFGWLTVAGGLTAGPTLFRQDCFTQFKVPMEDTQRQSLTVTGLVRWRNEKWPHRDNRNLNPKCRLILSIRAQCAGQ